MGVAGLYLTWRRLVVGRRTAHGRGNIRVSQLQAIRRVARRLGCWRIRPCASRPSESHRTAVHIAGEHASCPVRAVCSRRQREHEHSGIAVAESRARADPNMFPPVAGFLLACDMRAVVSQARAARAGHDLLVYLKERHGAVGTLVNIPQPPTPNSQTVMFMQLGEGVASVMFGCFHPVELRFRWSWEFGVWSCQSTRQ